MNNPLIFIDPDGRNTIYYNSKGEELHRTEDDHDNAIVIVGDDNLDAFNEALGNFDGSSDGVGNLRSFGDNYNVDGIIDLFNFGNDDVSSQSDIHPDYQLKDSNGKKSKNAISEWGSFLVEENGSICRSNCIFSDHNPYLVSGNTYDANVTDENIVGKVHTHPNAGKKFTSGGQTIGFTFGISQQDRSNSKYRKGNYYEAVIDTKSIYLYNGKSSITAPVKFFVK